MTITAGGFPKLGGVSCAPPAAQCGASTGGIKGATNQGRDEGDVLRLRLS